MDYDEILKYLGEKGRWNILQILLLCLPAVAGGIAVLVYSFTGKWYVNYN